MKSLLIFAIGTVLIFGNPTNSFSQGFLKEKLKENITKGKNKIKNKNEKKDNVKNENEVKNENVNKEEKNTKEEKVTKVDTEKKTENKKKEVKGVRGEKVYINEIEKELHENVFDHLCTLNPKGLSEYVQRDENRHSVKFSSEKTLINDQKGIINEKGETETIKTTFSINDPMYFSVLVFYGPQSAYVAELDENGDYYDGVYYDFKTNKFGKDDGTTLGIPTLNTDAEVSIKLYMDGKLVSIPVCIEKFRQNRFFSRSGFYYIKVHDIKKNMESDCWKKLMASLSEGEHTLKVEVYPYDNEIGGKKANFSTKYPMATGECTIVRKPGEGFSISYGKTWKEYFVAANDTELEKTVLASAKRRKSNITDTKLTSTWRIVRNKLTGAIIRQYCTAAFLYKTDEGNCEVVEYEFLQEYYGGKFQGEIKMNYSTDTYSIGTNRVVRVDCE